MAATPVSSDQLSAENMALIKAIEARMQHEVRTEVQKSTDDIMHVLDEIRAMLKTAQTKRTTSHAGSSGGATRTTTSRPVRKQKSIREIVAYLFSKDLPRALEIFGKVLEFTGELNPIDKKMKVPVPKEKIPAHQCTAMKKWCDSNATTPIYAEIKEQLMRYGDEIMQSEEPSVDAEEPETSGDAPASDELIDGPDDDVPQPPTDADTARAPSGDVADVVATATTTRVTTKKAPAPRATTKKQLPPARNPAISRT